MPEINAVVAIYIDANGEIVASENVYGLKRVIAENLLNVTPMREGQTEILKVEVSVDSQVVGQGCCTSSTKYVMRRICYDKFGRPYQCF